MESVYRKDFSIGATDVNFFDRLKLSRLLAIVQEASGDHSDLLGSDWDTLNQKHLFWAVIRHRVQITRLPRSGETITVQTWPMPTTRIAYPRAAAAYDADGNELFRSASLWVLMDTDTRAMVLPGKSGVIVEGHLEGCELALPGSLIPKELAQTEKRTVRYTELDINGHINNCRYLDWVEDLLPSRFHQTHCPREFVACYLSEGREDEALDIRWELSAEAGLRMDVQRSGENVSMGHSRVFSAQLLF